MERLDPKQVREHRAAYAEHNRLVALERRAMTYEQRFQEVRQLFEVARLMPRQRPEPSQAECESWLLRREKLARALGL